MVAKDIRPSGLVVAAVLALGAGACTQTASTSSGSPDAPPVSGLATAPAEPKPSGDAAAGPKGCAAEIARFRSIIEYDVSVGRLERGVFGRASADLRQAETVCTAGREVQARAILISTKRTYGYPS